MDCSDIQKRKKMLFQVIIPGDPIMPNWNHFRKRASWP